MDRGRENGVLTQEAALKVVSQIGFDNIARGKVDVLPRDYLKAQQMLLDREKWESERQDIGEALKQLQCILEAITDELGEKEAKKIIAIAKINYINERKEVGV
jgi:hypothetical protein